MDKIKDIYKFEDDLASQGYQFIAGCDEAGRGPMAGPLVVCSVVLPVGLKIEHLNDSKKLSAKKREELYKIIIEKAFDVQVEVIDVASVDKLNPYQASKIGMCRCCSRLSQVDYILTDAMPLEGILMLKVPVLPIIKGDSKSASIAAASVIAKVTRDRIMHELSTLYPHYEFDKHKGYVTKRHLELLGKYGVSPIHRRSFAPVKQILEKEA